MIERYEAVRRVVGDVADFAVIAGLGSAVLDMARLSGNAAAVFPLDGAMGAAVSMGLGLALQRPDLDVLVVTGDGELLMNVGALATVAVQDPGNLSIVCIDNGRYGLTGGQLTHTSYLTDLETMASGAGIRLTMTCREEGDFDAGVALIRTRDHASFVVLKVGAESSAPHFVDRDASGCRLRFIGAIAPDAVAQRNDFQKAPR